MNSYYTGNVFTRGINRGIGRGVSSIIFSTIMRAWNAATRPKPKAIPKFRIVTSRRSNYGSLTRSTHGYHSFE